MKTKTSIKFGLVDVTAKKDSNLNVNDMQDFVNLDDLKRDDMQETKYGTLEKNQFALDGTFQLLPDNELTQMGLWSKRMSDKDGNFATPLVLEIDFTEVHSSLGITLVFSESGDYCNNLNIKFYDYNNNLISDKDFTPNAYYYVCNNSVERYKKIVITFYSTNNPYRYLKLYKILYGADKIFDGSSLRSAKILEEVDLLSSEISINTCDFSIYSDDGEFNVINPQGVYKLLQTRQRLTVTMNKSGTDINMGVFYLDDWENEDDTISNFKTIDLIGILDKTDFKGGMYENINAEDLISQIFVSAKADGQYEISENLKGIKLTGYIPICSHREAIQQVAFVLGAVVDCSRTDIVKIYRVVDEKTPPEINKNRKESNSSKVNLNDIVTGVEIITHNYTKGTEITEIYKETLETGIHEITFSDMVYDLQITGATILESNVNYALIEVAQEQEVIINGKKYVDNTKLYGQYIEDLTEDEKENILTVESAYLVNTNNVKEVAERILNYYKNTYKHTFKFIMDSEKVTDSVIVDSLYSQQLIGPLTKLDIDLVGGFIANATQIGKLKE